MADSSPDDISAQAELKTGQKRAGAERSNARQRASLACVPCRSKHVKHPVSLYYANFHVAHSWLPPRGILQTCYDAKPDDLRFLMAVVSYIGSLYSESGGNPTLRQQAYSMFNKELPPTIWSVQALLSLSVAAFGQLDDYGPIFERACQLALNIQLQHKRTADGYKDPVLAESCRRTYWGLYIHRSLLAIPANQLHSLLFPVVTSSGTELPCEEWEYETGNIPVSVSLEEYNLSDPSRDFSSWAYFIDIIRIRDRSVAPSLQGLGKAELFLNTANQQIDSWRLRLKNWKRDRVDDDGMVDTILYHALGVSFSQPEKIWRVLAHVEGSLGKDAPKAMGFGEAEDTSAFYGSD
ncbi:c6 transcription factor [Fusarium heterosporum]|uniref:C6 transcription factor n=1 Tax=Fusarium heterosporum TaxID=42747 RepID=A0A8H5WYX2_FUSHE|nr:c6 transcription factor [Fusarium heterosporum]